MKNTLIVFVLLVGCTTLMSACGSSNENTPTSCGKKVCINGAIQ